MRIAHVLQYSSILLVAAFECSSACALDELPARGRGEQPTAEFDIAKTGDIVILPVRIGEKEYPFVLSTASPQTVVDTRLCPKTVRPRAQTTGSGSTPGFEPLLSTPMKIGPEVILSGRAPLCQDLTEIREQYGHDIFGIIGLDFLRERIIQFDFDRGKLRLLSSIEDLDLTVDADACIPLHSSQPNAGAYWIYLEISGEIYPFVVDTLLTRSLSVNPGLMDEFSKTNRISNLEETSFAISPSSRFCMREASLKNVALHIWTQHNTPIVEQERNRIGLGYLSRFKATFDFKKRSLYLTPVARSEPTDGFRMRVGIELATRKSDIEVRHVFPDRLAASAGVRPGDIVVEVDGIAAGKLGKFEIERRLVCNDDVRVRFRRSKRETNLTSEYTIEFERLSQTKRTWKMTSAGAGETKH